jgi:hypothetical protein
MTHLQREATRPAWRYDDAALHALIEDEGIGQAEVAED